MSPRMKTRSFKTYSCKKSVSKTKGTALKKPSVKKSKFKCTSKQKTPMNEKKIDRVPFESPVKFTFTPIEANENPETENIPFTPKQMKIFLTGYKHSPDYDDLKRKRFNTSFLYGIKRSNKDIKIFTPEEDNSPKWNESLPSIKKNIEGEPGQAYADVFMSIPGFSDENDCEELDQLIETKSKCSGKKGRKKSIGYKGVPLPDECLITNYSALFCSPE